MTTTHHCQKCADAKISQNQYMHSEEDVCRHVLKEASIAKGSTHVSGLYSPVKIKVQHVSSKPRRNKSLKMRLLVKHCIAWPMSIRKPWPMLAYVGTPKVASNWERCQNANTCCRDLSSHQSKSSFSCKAVFRTLVLIDMATSRSILSHGLPGAYESD